MASSFAMMLSAARNEKGIYFIIGVSNRKKTSGRRSPNLMVKQLKKLYLLGSCLVNIYLS
jgi:hypothetical protein